MHGEAACPCKKARSCYFGATKRGAENNKNVMDWCAGTETFLELQISSLS